MMRWVITLALVVTLAGGGCKRPTPSAATATIPLPADLASVDPLIGDLLRRTAAAVRAAPTDAATWARHASALLANAYYEASVSASEVALSLDPDLQHLRYRQAVTRWRLEQADGALADLQVVLDAQANYGPGWLRLARWRLERGELEEARIAVDRAIERNPRHAGAVVTRAQVLLQLGDAQGALDVIEPHLAGEQVPPWMHHVAAQVYRRLGRAADMEESLALAGPLPERWPDPWLNEIALLATGKRMIARNAMDMLRLRGPAVALPMLRRAVEADSENPDLVAALAFALHSTGDVPAALSEMARIEGGTTGSVNYFKQYAMLCAASARGEDRDAWLARSLGYAQRAIEHAPDDPALLESAATVALLLDRAGQAAALYKRAGALHAAARRWAAAMDAFSHAIRIQPGDEDAMLDLAGVQVSAGEEDQARATLRELLDVHPGHEAATVLLDELTSVSEP